MKHLYRLLVVCTVCVLILALLACKDLSVNAQTAEERFVGDETAKMPTIDDCKVDPQFDLSLVRLVFYSPETGWTEDPATAPFDESKPTYIHAHGQGGDGHMYTAADMYNRGYNVINFYWGAFADDDLFPIEYKIWDNIGQYVVDENGNHRKVKSDLFECTVPEIYAARYCDFFALHPNYNMPIHMVGHSYGGQLTLAMSAYLTTLWQQGRLPARLLPDRYTLLDPYFDNATPKFNCKWLGGQYFKDSSVSAAIYCLQNILFPNNIAIEMLRTSPFVEMSMLMGAAKEDAPDYFEELKAKMRVVELANHENLMAQEKANGGSLTDQIAICHSIANALYPNAKTKDVCCDEDGVPIFGCDLSASAILLTNGMHFDFTLDETDYKQYQNMEFWRTEVDEEPADFALIGGLVSYDANGNGKMDEGAAYRLHGVSVTVCDEKGKTLATIDTENGFWKFQAQKGKTYTVKVNAPNYTAQQSTVKADVFATTVDFALAK